VGYVDQPDFINAVAQVETTLAPRALLAALLDIEHRHGRERSFRNAPRTLDLDLLLYGDAPLPRRRPDAAAPTHARARLRAAAAAGNRARRRDSRRGHAADWLAACADQSVTPMFPPAAAVNA